MTIRKFFLILFALTTTLVAKADVVRIGNMAYVLYSDSAKLVPISGHTWGGDVEIPGYVTYDGLTYRVAIIGNNAFRDNTGLEGITIPNTVDSIGKTAFGNCSSLVNVTVSWPSDKVPSLKVDASAFDADRLAEITLHVPQDDIAAYQSATPWKHFTIVGYQTGYTISYNLKGGALESGVENPPAYDENTPSFVLHNPVLPGYIFRGWNVSGRTYVAIITGSAGDRSYEAVWWPAQEITKKQEYVLTDIPEGWSVKAADLDVPVTNGITAGIAPTKSVQLCPPADSHVQSVELLSVPINLSAISLPETIICGEGDTITGTTEGNIMIVIPDGMSVVFRDAHITNGAAHPAVLCQGSAIIKSEGVSVIQSTQIYQPGIQAAGKGTSIKFEGSGDMTVIGGGNVDPIDLDGATATNDITGNFVGNDPIVYAPNAKAITYDGTAQELIYPGATNGGVFKYSLDKKSWNTAVPTSTLADVTQCVYYKVDAEGIYNASAVDSIYVTIGKKIGRIYFAHEIMVKNVDDTLTNKLTNTGDGTVAYSSSDATVASVNANTGQVTCKKEGRAVITATVTGTQQYAYPVPSVSYTLYVNTVLPDWKEYEYTETVQTFISPAKATYKLEVWGAAGGSQGTSLGGKGGYATCQVSLKLHDTLYVYVGGAGKSVNGTDTVGGKGGWNGGGTGGTGYTGYPGGGGGGGATHISKANNDIIGSASPNKQKIDSTYIIIAGGGGGAGHPNSKAGDGGGADGGLGYTSKSDSTYATTWYHNQAYSYGKTAGNAGSYSWGKEGSGGGGAGYCGGNAQGNHTGAYSSSGGCGGSSSCNATYGSGYSTTAGQRAGNGYVKITFINYDN